MKKALRFVFALGLILSVFAVPAGTAHAAQPCFNCLPQDKETLRLKNRTAGDSAWHDPISANPGDSVAFNVYYNNSSLTEFAHNTKIEFLFPKDASTHIVTYGTVSADNVTSATDAGTINVSGQATLTLQSQAYWYPNQTTANPQVLTITYSDRGPFKVATVTLGEIGPCYPYSGQVVFEGQLSGATPTPTPTPTSTPNPISYVNISKTVRNLSGNTSFAESVNANQGDQVQFSVTVTGGGTTSTAGDVLVQDTLPSYLTLVSGTVRLDGGYVADSWLFTSGVDIGVLSPGQSRTIQFNAQVATGIPNYSQTLTNWAKAWSNTGNVVQDSAQVFVGTYAGTGLMLTKQSRDLAVTVSSTYYQDLYTVPGRDIEFSMGVTNNGSNTATNVVVQDSLPSAFTYDPYSTTLDGSLTSEGIVSSGLNIGSLYPGQMRVVKFRATLAQTGFFTQNTTQLVNTAFARADNVSQVSATANVWVVKQGRVLGASTVDTGVDMAGMVTLGSTGVGSFLLGAYQIARKRILRSKISALRKIDA